VKRLAIAGRLVATAAVLLAGMLLARLVPFTTGTAAAPTEPERTAPPSAPAAREATPGDVASLCSGATPCPGSPEEVLAGFGLTGFSLTPAAVAPRTEPVPAVPGSVEVARYRQAGLTLVLDRPADPDLATDLAALAFLEAGWRPMAGPIPPETGEPAVGQTFVRGDEVAIITHDDSDPGDPLLLIVHHHSALESEDAP
jgi:hypothetical protein